MRNKIKTIIVQYWHDISTFEDHENGILLPKLFGPTMRKNCSSDQEKIWNSSLKAKNLQKFWDKLEQLEFKLKNIIGI